LARLALDCVPRIFRSLEAPRGAVATSIVPEALDLVPASNNRRSLNESSGTSAVRPAPSIRGTPAARHPGACG